MQSSAVKDAEVSVCPANQVVVADTQIIATITNPEDVAGLAAAVGSSGRLSLSGDKAVFACDGAGSCTVTLDRSKNPATETSATDWVSRLNPKAWSLNFNQSNNACAAYQGLSLTEQNAPQNENLGPVETMKSFRTSDDTVEFLVSKGTFGPFSQCGGYVTVSVATPSQPTVASDGATASDDLPGAGDQAESAPATSRTGACALFAERQLASCKDAINKNQCNESHGDAVFGGIPRTAHEIVFYGATQCASVPQAR